MPKTTKVSRAQAQRALAVLCKYGRQSFKPTASVRDSDAVGVAIARVNTTFGLHAMAQAALEDANHHLSAAAVDSLSQGKWKRRGRALLVTLAPVWAEIK